MQLIIVNSSPRRTSQSGKIAKYVHNRLSAREGIDSQILDFAGNPLPLWDEGVWEKAVHWQERWLPVQAALAKADAFVFVVPEWGGMVPAVLKNFFLFCSARELGHKPALLISISSSINGSYPIAELRMSSYKNNRILYIPEQLIIRNVEKVFNAGDPVSEDDAYLRKRLDHCLELLEGYGHALRNLRRTSSLDFKTYPYGM